MRVAAVSVVEDIDVVEDVGTYHFMGFLDAPLRAQRPSLQVAVSLPYRLVAPRLALMRVPLDAIRALVGFGLLGKYLVDCAGLKKTSTGLGISPNGSR